MKEERKEAGVEGHMILIEQKGIQTEVYLVIQECVQSMRKFGFKTTAK